MALQNRVDPMGRIFATPERGLFMGNRGGALHDDNRRIVRDQASASWIICRTEFKGRTRELMAPGRYTELFFLDEATALSAGHRPCFECRREDADRFLTLFRRVTGMHEARAKDIDKKLSAQRRLTRFGSGTGKIAFLSDPRRLADGVMVSHRDQPYVVRNGAMRRWSPGGYEAQVPLPDDELFVLTPRATAQVLAAGYRAVLHDSIDS